MKTTKLLVLVCIVTLQIFILITSATAVNVPTTEVKSTIEAILDTLRDKNLSRPAKKEDRRNKIRTLIKERFDFDEMAQRALATHWEKRTPAEKKEFTSIFSELLEASYIGKIEAYTDEKITYDKELVRDDGKFGAVNTTIVTKNVNIPIDYKVMLKGNKWLVYDVSIEGVSLISTYRTQYNKIIVKESYTKLVEKMKSKLDEVNDLSGKEPSSKKEKPASS